LWKSPGSANGCFQPPLRHALRADRWRRKRCGLPCCASRSGPDRRRSGTVCAVSHTRWSRSPAFLQGRSNLSSGLDSPAPLIGQACPLSRAPSSFPSSMSSWLVWIGSRKKTRGAVLARIETELELSQKLTGSAYDRLLLAAWVLDAWPDRVRALSTDLKVATLSGRLLLSAHGGRDFPEFRGLVSGAGRYSDRSVRGVAVARFTGDRACLGLMQCLRRETIAVGRGIGATVPRLRQHLRFVATVSLCLVCPHIGNATDLSIRVQCEALDRRMDRRPQSG
jgi:hypothetical protein